MAATTDDVPAEGWHYTPQELTPLEIVLMSIYGGLSAVSMGWMVLELVKELCSL